MDIGKSHRHPTRPTYGSSPYQKNSGKKRSQKHPRVISYLYYKCAQTRRYQYKIQIMKKTNPKCLIVRTQCIIGNKIYKLSLSLASDINYFSDGVHPTLIIS